MKKYQNCGSRGIEPLTLWFLHNIPRLSTGSLGFYISLDFIPCQQVKSCLQSRCTAGPESVPSSSRHQSIFRWCHTSPDTEFWTGHHLSGRWFWILLPCVTVDWNFLWNSWYRWFSVFPVGTWSKWITASSYFSMRLRMRGIFCVYSQKVISRDMENVRQFHNVLSGRNRNSHFPSIDTWPCNSKLLCQFWLSFVLVFS